ncbi:hypothetical protein [Arthrobacter sp. CAN_C5]|nr:hypothetical protein [Arthrobacter sp. CAN_C5]
MSDFDRYSLTIARWLTTLPEQRAHRGKLHHPTGRNPVLVLGG